MRTLFNQLRQVLRRLGRAPMFTAITLITLSLGVGANTAIFSVVEAVLLKPLPYPDPEKLIGVWYTAPGINLPHLNMAPFMYFITREQSTTLTDIGVYDGDAFTVTGSGDPEHVRGLDVTDGTLPLLGVQPVAGRLFSRRDDTPGAPATIMISYAFWQKRFGGAASAVGSTLVADGKPRQIIGVLPRTFEFLDYHDAQIFAPMQWDRTMTKLGNFSDRAIARLKPGVTIEQASADQARLIPIALRGFPPPPGFSVALFDKAHFAPNLAPLKKDVIGDVGSVLWVLMASIGTVLLVACANVANLLLVRVEGRRQELAIRAALGASWKRTAGELLFESFILGVVGSVAGLALAYGALRALVAAAPTGLPRLAEIGVDVPVLLFTLCLALGTSVLIGAIPIIKFAGTRGAAGLREGGRALSQSRERHRARKMLVVVQVALALVLLICSGLMIRTFQALTHVNAGFTNPDALQTFRIYISEKQYPDEQAERVIRLEQQMLNNIHALPGVEAVSLSSELPMDGFDSNDVLFAQDHQSSDGDLPPVRRFKFIAPGFFTAMGAHIVAGRDLTWDDTYGKRPVALISEKFAREYWHDASGALGKKIRVASTDQWREIVGVAQDMHDDGVEKDAPPAAYWPLWMENFEGQKTQLHRGVAFVIRTPRAGSQAFMSEVQQQVWALDAQLPLSDTQTMGALYTKSMARTSFTLVMLSIAGGMALLLGVVGIYGVISYTVSQRTREIGIRMALGAQRGELTSLFVRQGLWLTAIGSACGLVAAFAAMRLMSSILFNVSPMDPLTYTVITAVVAMTTLLACYLPSRRAATVNPVTALRSE